MSQGGTIVILGGGFAGAWCARALEKRLSGTGAEVLLIDRRNYVTFSPLLVEAGTGSLEPRHAVFSIRSFIRSAGFRMADVTGVDTKRQEVTCRDVGTGTTATVRYDHLVVALGSVTRLPPVPGLAEHGFEMKSLGDAVALRDRAIEMLEAADASPQDKASLLHFVVVGGNYTGVEVAGEFHVFLRQASRTFHRIDPGDCRVTLVEIADRVLSTLDPDLSDYAADRMRRRGIDVRLGESVAAIGEKSVRLASGGTLETRTVIWCAGIAPNPAIAGMGLPLDERGYLICDPDLRVSGHDNVWGIGDAAINPDPQGQPYPATAQHAVREGAHAAANIARVLRGARRGGGGPSAGTEPFIYSSAGSLAALGCRTGVAKMFGIRLSGFPAWFLWRTVYLLKMPGWSRKLRVALDWTMELLFRRDFVQLGVHRRREGPSH